MEWHKMIRGSTGAFILLLLAAGIYPITLSAQSDLQHFIYFGLDRDRIKDSEFLNTRSIVGAQLKYTWRELEPEPDQYALDGLRADLLKLEWHGKRLFIQLQDVSFQDDIINVPDYILKNPAFGGGIAHKVDFEDEDKEEANPLYDGWVARRWDQAVQDRFIRLLQVLAREFDGRIEGLNLPETAIGFGETGTYHPDGYSHSVYVKAVKDIMTAARAAFQQSHVIQYANFMPGEWLPWTDNGYLRSIYTHADKIGLGVGGPDLLPHRRGQLQHSLPMIADRRPHIVAGLAVQWGNLEEINPTTGKRVSVEELVHFATNELRLNYLFWGTQEPFYTEDILPYLQSLSSPGNH